MAGMALRRSRRALLLATLAAPLSAPLPARGQQRLGVVASFSILGDFVRTLAGDQVALTVLLGPEAEPHDFAPRPSAAVAVRSAALVLRNGLGLEPWMDRLLRAAPPRGRLLTLGEGISPLALGAGPDPHAWLDPQRAGTYLRATAAALAGLGLAPAEAPAQGQMAALDVWLAGQFAAIPAERRVFAVGHAGFGYLAARYGLRMLTPPAGAHGGQASAAALAGLVAAVRAARLAAVFSSGPEDAALMRRVAAEAGVPLAGRLYAETLSAGDGPAASYDALMRHNAQLLVAAMAG